MASRRRSPRASSAEDIFVVTKVWATYSTRPELCLDKSLKSLGLDYVDLVLVVSILEPKCSVNRAAV